MSADAVHPPGPSESRLPLIELDRALAPIRRLAAWSSVDPGERAVPYVEDTVDRWTGAALALDLPEPVRDLVQAQRDAVVGYDLAEPEDRSAQLASLYQAVCRLDALLGLPLHGVAIRPPRKPRLPDWRVEEVEEAAPDEASAEPQRDEAEPESGRGGRSRPRRGSSRTRSRQPDPEPPPPAPEPFWNGRMSAALSDLALPAGMADALLEAGVSTVEDLLLLTPVSTEHLRPVHGAGRALPEDAEHIAVGGRIKRRWTTLRPDGSREVRAQLKGAGRVTLVWPAGSRALEAAGGIEAYPPEARVIVAGRPVRLESDWEIADPERAWDDGAGGVRLRSYGVEVDDVLIRGVIGRLLPELGSVRDLLPGSELSRLGQESMKTILPELHHRDEERARRRLAFDEAYLVQLGLSLSRYRQGRDRGIQITPLHGLIARLESLQGMGMSDQQLAVFEDIKRDLRRKTPMRRVLTGDTGSGRGLVALMATATVAEGKSQVMVLAPDALSAELRYLFAVLPLREGGLVARLVEGEPTKAIRDAIGRGEIHVVFGTLDLLERDLEFRRLGLVLAEEGGTAGAASAALNQMRAPRPHGLLLPRRPVNPLLALTAYSDHDISVLTGGAPAPKVGLVPATERSVVYGRAAETVAAGQQVLVVFPLVKGIDALDIREAWRLVKALESDAFGKARMGLFHGSMSREERLRAYDDFCNRRVDVLVATSPIEEGPPSAGAATLVLEQAERFTPERQLRLRGFLQPRRGDPAIWCVHSGSAEDANERLGTLIDPEANPIPQGGIVDEAPKLPELQWLDLDRDAQLFWAAREAAHRLAVSDPRLRSGWANDVGRALSVRWTEFYGDDAPDLKLEDSRGSSEPSRGSGATQGQGRRRRRRRRKS